MIDILFSWKRWPLAGESDDVLWGCILSTAVLQPTAVTACDVLLDTHLCRKVCILQGLNVQMPWTMEEFCLTLLVPRSAIELKRVPEAVYNIKKIFEATFLRIFLKVLNKSLILVS